MFFFKNLFKKPIVIENPLNWDMHNHLLPGIDDGAQNEATTLAMLNNYIEMGYEKLTATPHVMSDFYLNTPEIIEEKYKIARTIIKANELPLELSFAAEYYIDGVLVNSLRNDGKLMTFGDNYILIETSFLSKPMVFESFVFDLISKGYQPVFAHPERYVYFHEDYEALERMIQLGLKLQINLLSILGHYSPQAKKLAQWMIEHKHYHFLGTDAHKPVHIQMLNEVYKDPHFHKIDFDKVINSKFYNL